MKSLPLLLISGLLTMTANAQLDKIDVKKFNNDPTYQKIIIQNLKALLADGNASSLSYNNSPRIDELLRFPINTMGIMPCLKPNTKDIAAIPNAFEGKVGVPFKGNSPQIPNPFNRQSYPSPYKESYPLLPKN